MEAMPLTSEQEPKDGAVNKIDPLFVFAENSLEHARLDATKDRHTRPREKH